MRYVLVLVNDTRQIDFACKRDLIDWIKSHKPMMTDYYSSRLSVHRGGKPKFNYSSYVRLDKLCSLKDFIVKHKLL